MLIFVTGKSGCGKSTFSKMLADKLHFAHIDIDKLGMTAFNEPEVSDEAVKLFGDSILNGDGKVNTTKLGQLIFVERDSSKVSHLRYITWKYIKKYVKDQIKQNAVVEYILLPQTMFWKLKSVKILIKATNDNLRDQNMKTRDHISQKSVTDRDNHSIEYSEAEFDHIITNDYNEKHLEKSVTRLSKLIIKSNQL